MSAKKEDDKKKANLPPDESSSGSYQEDVSEEDEQIEDDGTMLINAQVNNRVSTNLQSICSSISKTETKYHQIHRIRSLRKTKRKPGMRMKMMRTHNLNNHLNLMMKTRMNKIMIRMTRRKSQSRPKKLNSLKRKLPKRNDLNIMQTHGFMNIKIKIK